MASSTYLVLWTLLEYYYVYWRGGGGTCYLSVRNKYMEPSKIVTNFSLTVASCPLAHSSKFGRVGTWTILSLHNMQQSGGNDDDNPYQMNSYLIIVVSSINISKHAGILSFINTPLESLDSSILGHACAECMHYTKPQQPSINNSFHFPISWYDGSIWGWHYQLHLH